MVEHGLDCEYEPIKISYLIPARKAAYKPDWRFKSTGLLLETKGWLRPADRVKLALVKEQHPELNLRVLFDSKHSAAKPILKGSPTTSGEWLEAHGIPWAAEAIPREWIIADIATQRGGAPIGEGGVQPAPEGAGGAAFIRIPAAARAKRPSPPRATRRRPPSNGAEGAIQGPVIVRGRGSSRVNSVGRGSKRA